MTRNRSGNARRWLGMLCFSAFFVSCAPVVQVGTAHDPTVQHSGYKTFAMMQPNRPIHSENPDVDPFVMQRLRQITYLRLAGMGYKPVPKPEAQLLVAVVASRSEELYVYSSGPSYYDRRYGSPMGPYSHVSRSDEGIVVIDLIDSAKKSVVWRGTGTKSVDGKLNEGDLTEIVDAILAKYPPGQIPEDE